MSWHGKSAIEKARQFSGGKINLKGRRLWAGEYGPVTGGFESDDVKKHIREQNKRGKMRNKANSKM